MQTRKGTISLKRIRSIPTLSPALKQPDSPLRELITFFDESLNKSRRKRMASKEFQHKYRPRTFKQVKGQRDAVKALRSLLKKPEKFPHAVLFSGPSGCGKNTLALILKKKLGCDDLRKPSTC